MTVNGYQVTYKRNGKLHREFFTSLPSAQARAMSHRDNRRIAVSDPKLVKLNVTNIG